MLKLLQKETVKNFFWRGMQIFGKQGIGIILFFLLAKLLSPTELGIYSYIIATIFLLGMLGDFGISTATSKYVAEYHVKDKRKLSLVFTNSALIISCVAILLIILVFFFGGLWLGDKHRYILFALPMLLFYPLTSLLDGIYVGMKRFRELASITVTLGLISIVYFYFLIQAYGVFGALISQNIFYFSLFAVLLVGYRDHKRFEIEPKVMKEITSYSIILGLGSVGTFLYTRIDVIVLGQLNFISQIAYYEFAYKVFNILIMPAFILGTVVAPTITRRFAQKKFSQIKSKMLRESGLIFLLGIIGSLVTYFIFPYFFVRFFEQYDVNFLMLCLSYLLILVPFRLASTYISIGYIISTGNAIITTSLLLVFGVVNLILDIVLINMFGFIGVIYATLITQFLLILCKDPYFYIKFRNYIKKSDRT